MAKKRFGVSISIALAEHLDSIARSMNVDRSMLVEKALNDFIEEQKHSAQEHQCCGVLIVETNDCAEVNRAAQTHRDVVVSYLHSHIDNRCVCVFLLQGSSQRVLDLHRYLTLNSYRVRYVPVAHE